MIARVTPRSLFLFGSRYPTVAALFVEHGGAYWDLPDVEPWDEYEDARRYAGPYPVVAHPPCARWGRYWHGGPSARQRMLKGDDDGCFGAALAAVRTWGGVLEHPESSYAWPEFGIARPPRRGGWVRADVFGGWTCCVEQGHYGHRARKATWLYVCSLSPLPSLVWGSSASIATCRIDGGGFHTAEERRRAIKPPKGMTKEQRAARRRWLADHERETGRAYCAAECMSRRERLATPLPFRDLLLSIARSARASEAAA